MPTAAEEKSPTSGVPSRAPITKPIRVAMINTTATATKRFIYVLIFLTSFSQ